MDWKDGRRNSQVTPIRLFKYYLRVPFVLLGIVEFVIFSGSVYAGAHLRFLGASHLVPLHIGPLLPRALSFLAHGDSDAEVIGLEDIPRDQWPNTLIVHWAFDIMVGSGFAMLTLAGWAGWLWVRRRRLPDDKWLLRALVAAGPLGFIAIETGWFVTEVGRQPWIIYGIMRTEEAVTPMPGLVVPFTTFTALYVFLSVILVFLLRRQFMETHPESPATGEAARVA